MNYLLDANVVSDLLRGHEPVRSRYLALASASFLLSPVVDYEVRRYLLLKGATRNLAQFEALIATWAPITFGTSSWTLAAQLWADRHRVGLAIADADLLIAVSALQQDATLVTNNRSDFAGLGLRIEDWRS